MAATLAQMTAALKRRGHRMTAQRRIILGQVARSEGHIEAEAIHRALSARRPSVDRSTVYRTLDLLERLGYLAHHHDATGIAYHHAGEHAHVHLACLACDHVDEIEDLSIGDELIERLRQRQGFEANLGHSTIFGICRACTAAGHALDTHHRHATEAGAEPR